MRLRTAQWIVVLFVVIPLLAIASPVWKRVERFDHPRDYRIPYALSRDYWLYERHLQTSDRTLSNPVYVVGDSVVWGEFVSRDGTLSHFLEQQCDVDVSFVNAGVNGMFPLALEGLVRHHGGTIHGKKVILHCNLLWMSSPEADLSSSKEQSFNHARLVPQFQPSIRG